MATDAKRHFDRGIRFGKRELHFGYVPVAFQASDFTDRYMSSMGKIDMVWNPVDLDPRNGLILFNKFHQFFLFFALRDRLFVTFFANVDVRDRGLLVGKNIWMAVEAIQTDLFDMFVVVI